MHAKAEDWPELGPCWQRFYEGLIELDWITPEAVPAPGAQPTAETPEVSAAGQAAGGAAPAVDTTETNTPPKPDQQAPDLLAVIPDHRDRQIVRLWREHYTYAEIANWEDIALSAGRVANIITDLRRKYTEKVVPRHR